MNNKYIIAGFVVLALAVAGLYLRGPVEKVIERVVERPVGATPGQDFQGPISIAGTSLFGNSSRFNLASSTLCALRSPSATATLLVANVAVTGAPTTSPWYMHLGRGNVLDPLQMAIPATSTVVASTTVNIGEEKFFSLASGTPGIAFVGATSSDVLAIEERTFPPNNLLTLKAAAQNGASFSWQTASGTCTALWAR